MLTDGIRLETFVDSHKILVAFTDRLDRALAKHGEREVPSIFGNSIPASNATDSILKHDPVANRVF